MLPFQPQADHFNYPTDASLSLELKKQQARLILDSLDDNAMLRLAHEFQERGLVNIPQLVASSQSQFGNLIGSSMAFPHYQLGTSMNPAMGANMVVGGHSTEAFLVGALPPGPVTPASYLPAVPPGPVPSLSSFIPPMLPPTYPATTSAPFTMPSVSPIRYDPIPPPPPHVPPNLPPGNWAPEPSLPNGLTFDSSVDYDGSYEAQTVERKVETSKNSEQSDSRSASTTLILRNFPPSFGQEKVEEWVNNGGYEGLYDFLLWFPAKSTSRLNSCGYAFVNFRTETDASRFMHEQHFTRFPPEVGENESIETLPLSVAVAKVQGFADNYARFHHLTQERAATRCAPFFAKEAVAVLSVDDILAATDLTVITSQNYKPALVEISGPVTTIVIRNLPNMIDGSDTARRWLDLAGYAQRYDFLLYLPAKRSRQKSATNSTNPAAQLHGYGYAFVNFKEPSDAQSCIDSLHGLVVGDADVALNIVAAKIQGRPECVDHFSSLVDGGRCKVWIEPANQPPAAIVSQRSSFQ